MNPHVSITQLHQLSAQDLSGFICMPIYSIPLSYYTV